jgi:hypothetical protein
LDSRKGSYAVLFWVIEGYSNIPCKYVVSGIQCCISTAAVRASRFYPSCWQISLGGTFLYPDADVERMLSAISGPGRFNQAARLKLPVSG